MLLGYAVPEVVTGKPISIGGSIFRREATGAGVVMTAERACHRLGFELDLSVAANEKALWQRATELLPQRDLANNMPRYTQGVMDLGATVCTARKPVCEVCPLASDCMARAQDAAEKYPLKTRKLKRSSQSLWLLWAQTTAGEVWLSPRPSPGVWAGLYCMELFDSYPALQASVPARYREKLQDAPPLRHVLTQALGRDPQIEEIAKKMKVTVDKVRSISQVVRETYSLDMLIGDQEEDTLKDILQDTNAVSPASISDEIRRKEHIDDWLTQLTVSERKVIELRFGLQDGEPKTLDSIGKEFGITRERVRQIETQALNKLRVITKRKKIDLEGML